LTFGRKELKEWKGGSDSVVHKEEVIMATFVMLTRLSPSALRSPQSLEELERRIKEQVDTECPQVEWLHNFAILGGCDYLDIFNAPDLETAMKLSTIIRTYGHAHTEVWTAVEWQKYKEMIRHLPAGEVGGAGEGV
jgi:uncharacterized protein with GYD domain